MRPPRYPRIACIVPFCGCGLTRFPPGCEVICQKHHALVDPALKARRRRIQRMARRRPADAARLQILDQKLWAKIVSQAITRAGST